MFVCISVQLLSTAVPNHKYLGKKVDFLMYMYYHGVQQNLMVPLLKFPSTAIVKFSVVPIAVKQNSALSSD